jgi:hypothetical protein
MKSASSQRRPHLSRRRNRQGGYAILLVLFLMTLLILASVAVAPNLKTQAQREREKEMIWRGKQYIRGVKLYYRKTGKFPTSLDDLTKPKLASIRFMRQAYKDPMNNKDGEWRLIYVGPAGQLIGSLKPQRALQLTGIGGFQGIGGVGGVAAPSIAGGIGQPAGQQPFGQSLGGQSSFGSQPFGASATPGQGTNSLNNNTGFGQNAAGASSAVSADTSVPGTSADTPEAEAANEALLNSDPPTVTGGNIIGVGSKINQSSITIYETAKNYKQFEFIWDPSKDALVVGGTAGPKNGVIPGTQQPQQGLFGAPANSLAPGAGNSPNPSPSPNNPFTPEPTPPETSPNPPPQP